MKGAGVVKILLLCLLLSLSFPNHVTAQSQLNCRPAQVKAWLALRQSGLDRIQPIVEQTQSLPKVTDGLLLVQLVRRDLEDAPRPSCADGLYILTIYLYDALGDCWTHQLIDDRAWCERVTKGRIERYRGESGPLVRWLTLIARAK